MIMIDFSKLKAMGPLDQHQLKDNIAIEIDKTEDFIKNIWYTNLINIFTDKQNFKPVSTEQLNSFFNSTTTLIANQVNHIFLIEIIFNF